LKRALVPGCLLLLALSACTGTPPRPQSESALEAAYARRAVDISAWSSWGFDGRLSMDDGEDGGSGSLRWRTDGPDSRLDFRGALGRGAWRLSIAPGRAVLEKADGSRTEARSVDDLIRLETGWEVPVDALAYWARGLRAPGEVAKIEFDQDGRIVRLEQSGWSIRFERYRDAVGTELPGKIEAVRGQLRLKLVPARWAVPVSDASHA
jgi:outer membrane lipoprotein LolB